MSADSEKPHIVGGYLDEILHCTAAKLAMGRPIISERQRVCRLCSAADSINSGRHFLDFTMRRMLRRRRVAI